MPFEAIYEGETVAPHQAPFRADAECPDCGGTVRVWRSTERHARHFKHVDKIGQSGAGGPTAASCEYVGETDKHRKWKSLALSKLTAVFDDVSEKNYYTGEDEAVIGVSEAEEEKKLPAPATSRKFCKADVAVMFNERDEQLGRGVAVEVQHKNKGKNRLASIVDYVEQDMSVVWMSEDDFSTDACLLNEIDIRRRAADAIPNPDLWPRCDVSYEIERVRDELASEWPAKCRSLSDHSNPIIPAVLPEGYVWQEIDWDWSAMFSEYDEYEYRIQAALPNGCNSTTVPAKLPDEWRWERASEIWSLTDPDTIFNEELLVDSRLPDEPEHVRVPVEIPEKQAAFLQAENIKTSSAALDCRECNWDGHAYLLNETDEKKSREAVCPRCKGGLQLRDY